MRLTQVLLAGQDQGLVRKALNIQNTTTVPCCCPNLIRFSLQLTYSHYLSHTTIPNNAQLASSLLPPSHRDRCGPYPPNSDSVIAPIVHVRKQHTNHQLPTAKPSLSQPPASALQHSDRYITHSCMVYSTNH